MERTDERTAGKKSNAEYMAECSHAWVESLLASMGSIGMPPREALQGLRLMMEDLTATSDSMEDYVAKLEDEMKKAREAWEREQAKVPPSFQRSIEMKQLALAGGSVVRVTRRPDGLELETRHGGRMLWDGKWNAERDSMEVTDVTGWDADGNRLTLEEIMGPLAEVAYGDPACTEDRPGAMDIEKLLREVAAQEPTPEDREDSADAVAEAFGIPREKAEVLVSHYYDTLAEFGRRGDGCDVDALMHGLGDAVARELEDGSVDVEEVRDRCQALVQGMTGEED